MASGWDDDWENPPTLNESINNPVATSEPSIASVMRQRTADSSLTLRAIEQVKQKWRTDSRANKTLILLPVGLRKSPELRTQLEIFHKLQNIPDVSEAKGPFCPTEKTFNSFPKTDNLSLSDQISNIQGPHSLKADSNKHTKPQS